MSSWAKVKGLFWQSGEPEQAAGSEQAISDAEFAELLGTDHAVPERTVQAVDPSTIAISTEGATVNIDFQAQYDAAGIPNTDEVEQLERFLNGLDQNQPQTSKLVAAKAFLGAVGKSVEHVLTDAEYKIDRVRAIRAGQEQATQSALSQEQAAIQELTAQVEQHKARMEELTRELEGVRRACLIEESRLQAARVFFGTVAEKQSQ